jgi:ADP-ribosylglycohydrolase/alpha-beta hydrolase superfamily lysophospholipase
MARLLDDPAVSANAFYPRSDASPAPPGARDVFIAVDDGAVLHARVHDTGATPSAGLVLFHGNGEVVADYDGHAAFFARAGARLAILDFRGYGQSTGTPTLRALVGDARPAVAALQPHLTRDGVPLPMVIMGRSLGSACAAEIARSCPRLGAGFVVESGFSDLVAFAGRRGVALGAVDEADREALGPLHKLGSSTAPLLVLHGAEDSLIVPAEARATFEASGSRDKRLVVVPGRGHNDVSLHPLYWDELGAFVGRVARAADKRAGCLVAQALGDALGFLVEGEHPVVCARFAAEAFASDAPPTRTRGPFAFGQYSDDTQLARELAMALIEEPGWAPGRFAARIANLFATDAIVGRGGATEAAALRLIAGTPWDQAGEPPPGAGNGAAMRVAPVALRFSDPAERLHVAEEQARVTHADPRARAAAVLVAEVVGDAVVRAGGELDGVGSTDWCAWMAERVRRLDPVLADGVRHLPAWLGASEEQAASAIATFATPPSGAGHAFERWPGISPFATPSALYAVYAYARSPRDAESVIRRAVSVGGDVDTVAAMAGAMVGAALGLSGLGPRLSAWARRLEDRGTHRLPDLVALAHALA